MSETTLSTATLRPVRLRTERRANPIGIDDRLPLFSWLLTGSGRGRAQTAYRVRVVVDGVGADPTVEGTDAVWDSGEVRSGDNVDIEYAGAPLRSRTRYAWAVRVLDEAGRDSGWSEPATFETGLFDEAEWGAAAWIGAAAEVAAEPEPSLDLVGPHAPIERVWLPAAPRAEGTVHGTVDGAEAVPAGERACLRGRFTVSDREQATGASLRVAGAETVRVWLNAAPVPVDGTADEVSAAITGALRTGSNVVAIEALTTGPPHGLVARLDIQLGDATTTVVTDGTWRAHPSPGPGWESPEFDDQAWALAQTYGLHGAPPYGREAASYRPVPYLRREFELATQVRRARLYVTALGVYEVYLNQNRVGDHRLAPGWTDYHTRVPYQTYDVTDLVANGRNAIAAAVGDGWYAGNVGWFGPNQYGSARLVRARLEIETADGETTVVTDESWRTAAGPIRYADLQNGEVVDARAARPGWTGAGFDDAAWEPVAVATPRHGSVEAEQAPPIRVLHELPARSVRQTPNGAFVVDFGQNLVGWVRLRLRADAGTKVVIQHAEVLDHRGELYTEALRGARQTDEYIARGDSDGEVFEPTFSVHGFRYVAVYGYPGELDPADITAAVAYADMQRTGEFSCSDENLNQLQQNIVWGQRGNFLSVPTDCPQRDERLGWTGDAQVFAATAAFNYDVRTFFRKWLRDLRDAQFDDGAVPHVAPDVISGTEWKKAAGAAGWGDAIAIIPHELFWIYADRRLVAENYEAVTSWLDYLQANSSDLIRPDHIFGDWLALMPTPRDLVQTAFFAYAADLAARLAQQLGHDDEATKWRDLRQRVRGAFRDKFVRGGGRVVSGTQTAYVLALRFGLFDPEEEQAAADHLVAEIASRNWHLSTGFLGAPFLLPVLSSFGHEDAAFRLLTQDTYPSWLYPVVHGDATTIWERWDSWSDSRGFQDPRMTSFNHYAYGAVGEWIYRAVGGIAAGAPGFERLVVRPRVGGGLTWAEATLDTVRGPVRSRWDLGGDTFTVTIEVPPNMVADVWLPTPDLAAVRVDDQPVADFADARARVDGDEVVAEIGSGAYTFTVQLG